MRKLNRTRGEPPRKSAGWARHGIQSFIAAQKVLMDLVAQENALLIGVVRKRLGTREFRPLTSMVEIAETGAKNMADVAKILLDLASVQTTLIVGGFKEGLRLPATARSMAEVVCHRVETLGEMQKRWLDVTAQQAESVSESYRDRKTVSILENLAELGRRGVEGFVESEKKFVNLVVQEFSDAGKGYKRTNLPRDRMEVLAGVLREAAQNYLETQTKVLELAMEGRETTAIPNHERKRGSRKAAQPSWGEVTEKSVKNLVTAEKALLDLAIKPLNGLARAGARGIRHRASSVGINPAPGARRVIAKVA
jgi:hypothetical protein